MKLLVDGFVSEKRSQGWLAPLFICLFALALYSINLDYIPVGDELYHVLAARGFLEHGEPRIAEGVYTRATLFTALIAVLFEHFGESIVVARLLSVVAGGVMMACMFAWTRAVAGTPVAWISTILFLVSPFAIHTFPYVRFYAIHALLFWLGAVATYAATAGRTSFRQTLVLALGAAACFAGATYLQIITLMGLVGIGLWLTLRVAIPWVRHLAPEKRRWILVGIAIVGSILALLAFSMVGAELLQRYREVPGHAEARQNHFWYYHAWLNLYYPTLWSIFPLAALAALAHNPKPALFSLCIFVPALLLSSFGGMKDLDYIFYALPFLFIVWALAITFVIAGVRNFIVDVTDRGLSALHIRAKAPLVATVMACTIGFMVLANAASVRAVAMLAGVTVPPEVKHPDWAAAAEPLRPWLDQASVVLTTSELETLYFLGDYDVLINKSRLSELPEEVEFGRDPRTGRPVVSTPESVALIIDCFPDSLIVTSSHRWRVSHQLDDDIANLIVERTVPIELPRASQIMAFHWERAPDAVVPSACADLPIPQRDGGSEKAADASSH